MSAADRLAVEGGAAVRRAPWPAWPRVTEASEAMLLAALRSGRWAISGVYTGEKPYERRFAEAYARFHGVPYCVPTCNGSSALVIALSALDVGPGDEVLVPGLTWSGCAAAVLRVGATPILVDVEQETLCMSPAAAEAAITDRTAALMLVHLYQSVADVDGLLDVCERFAIPLVEDCAQAHGARLRGRRVGTFGKVAAFSFQQSKLLTSGEGGAVVTSDARLYDRLQQLRADGRRWVPEEPVIGAVDLEEVGDVQGQNFCMSELHAALLLEGLGRLDEENARRAARFRSLAERLRDVEGVGVLQASSGTEPAFYQLVLRFDPETFGVDDVGPLVDPLSAELGTGVYRTYRPLSCNPLYVPGRSPGSSSERAATLDPSRFHLPQAEKAWRTCLTLPHVTLLADEAAMDDIVEAVEKVRRLIGGPRRA